MFLMFVLLFGGLMLVVGGVFDIVNVMKVCFNVQNMVDSVVFVGVF